MGRGAVKVTVYSDGGGLANPGPSACAAVVAGQTGKILVEHAIRIGEATNNIAEYEGLRLGIRLARLVGATEAIFITDSQLMANQVMTYWAIRDPELSKLHSKVTSELTAFADWKIQHVRREQNKRADWLVNRLIRPETAKGRAKEPSL